MADNKKKSQKGGWKRKQTIIDSDIAGFPLHERTFLEPITNVIRADDADEDMQDRLTPIDVDPETFARQQGEYDVLYGIVGERSAQGIHTNPTTWGPKGSVLPTGKFVSKTKGVDCTRCGEFVKASQTRPVEVERDGQVFIESQCYPPCEDYSDGVSPSRRNGL
jgi:hypothetical protein